MLHLYVTWSGNPMKKQKRCEYVLSNIKMVYGENLQYYDWTVEILFSYTKFLAS